jgi:hypothetical protein
LLAFARKQTIDPRVLDLNTTVEGMLKMLRRLIGEDIDLAWHPGVDLWMVKMDAAQIDQILANLCVNARDAITEQGKVTIETGNATLDESYCAAHLGFTPGDYVLLAVSDNGCGLDQETQKRLFEPFFTTKETGRGTGLGLSTVYGIIKQNNGFINVYSEPGQGTTFKICIPRHEGKKAHEVSNTDPIELQTVFHAGSCRPSSGCSGRWIAQRRGSRRVTSSREREPAGRAGYIKKPINPTTFMAEIEQYLPADRVGTGSMRVP